MINCKKCNFQNQNYYNYCRNDGLELKNIEIKYNIKKNKKICSICDARNEDKYNYCQKCGNTLNTIEK